MTQRGLRQTQWFTKKHEDAKERYTGSLESRNVPYNKCYDFINDEMNLKYDTIIL